MANEKKGPACVRCNGTNWIDLGLTTVHPAGILTDEKGVVLNNEQLPHLYQCGGGRAYIEPEDVKNGCMRLIRATPEDMDKATVI